MPSHTTNYLSVAEQLLEEEGWLQPSHSRLDTVLYYFLTSGKLSVLQQRAVASLWHQQNRSAIPCYELSDTGRKKLSGLNMSQLLTLAEQAMDFAISARRSYKRQDCTILVGTVLAAYSKTLKNLGLSTIVVSFKPFN